MGGHLDLLSVVSLACVNRGTKRVLSNYLKGVKAVRIDADEPASRLRAAAQVAAKLPQLLDIFIGVHRLDVRWMRSSSVGNKSLLDLSAATSSVRGQPLAAFTLAFVACQLASTKGSIKRVVPAKACEIDLIGRKLDLKAKDLGDVATAAVFGALAGANTPNLREVSLAQNKLTDASMEVLAAAIASGGLSQLKSLGLGENKIGPGGMAWLVVSLVGKEELTELAELPQLPELSEEAYLALGGDRRSRRLVERCSATSGFSSLVSLNFEGNLLGDQGAAALAAPLACGAFSSLEVLSLSRNGITDPSPITRAIATGEAPMLRRLLLQQNPLSSGATQELHDTVAASTPKPVPTLASARGGKFDEAPTGVAVRVRRGFQPTDAPKPKFVPAVRRGLSSTGANMRDVSAQIYSKTECSPALTDLVDSELVEPSSHVGSLAGPAPWPALTPLKVKLDTD